MDRVHFAPYQPAKDERWDGRAIMGHLLRRSGFGAPPEDIQRLNSLGLDDAVQSLFDEAPEQEAEFQDTFDRLNGAFVAFGEYEPYQVWWCYRMLRTRTPLREKLALFWHSHFATNVNKIDLTLLMEQQAKVFRTYAWGNFRDLLLAVCKDPAMVYFLDGVVNTKEHPNENFARELMELYTLGRGAYTETDVLEGARAFTGWTVDDTHFKFKPEAHDYDPKEYLGHQGPLDGTDVVDILVQHPALAPFLARKLLVYFACPNPADDVVVEAADVLREANLDIKQFLATLFLSRYFYSKTCRWQRIASPTELVIGTCRSLKVGVPAQHAREHISAMGQDLAMPPSVKGWEGEKKWINTSTWAARANFAQYIASLNGRVWSPSIDLNAIVPTQIVGPTMIVDILVDRFLDGRLDKAKREDLAAFLIAKGGKPDFEAFRNDEAFRLAQERAVIALLMSLPEYQTY